MKFNNITSVVSTTSNSNKGVGGEEKEFDYQSAVLYPSAGKNNGRAVDLTITLLNFDLDLNALRLKEDGSTEPNPECSVKIVHALPKKVNGRSLVESHKRLIPYTARENKTDANGNIYLKAGEVSAYYDKDQIRTCEFSDAQKIWKTAVKNDKTGKLFERYRRSIMVYVEAFLWNVSITENGTTKVEEVNKPVIVGFNVIDLFFNNQVGFGKALIKNFTDKDGNLFETFKFDYTATSLNPKARKGELNAKEQSMIDEMRAEVAEGKMEELFKNLRPISYVEMMELIESGGATIELPNQITTEVKSASSQKSITNSISKEDLDKQAREYGAKNDDYELDSDTPPF